MEPHGHRVRSTVALLGGRGTAAAGVAEDVLPVAGPVTLAELRDRAVALHPGTSLDAVLGVCSVLVGDRPVGSRTPRPSR